MSKLRCACNRHSSCHSHLTKSCRKHVIDPGEVFEDRGNLLTMIRFYAGHECLWNCQHEDYHNERKQKELWGWITRQFGGRLSRSHIEYHMKFLHAQALQVFKRMDRCRRMGVRFRRPTFDLLDEFRFLLQEPKPAECGTCNINEQKSLQSQVKCAETAKVPNTDELNEFCRDLKDELKNLPQNTCQLVQKKISSMLTTLKSEHKVFIMLSEPPYRLGQLENEECSKLGRNR